MASLESLLTRSLNAQSVVGFVTDDKAIAMEIVHTSSDAITSVTLISATSLEMIDAVETVTCTFATDSSTLGDMVDRINASENWEARILDGLRSTATASSVLLPDSAITAATVNGESVYKVFFDTSVVKALFFRAAMDRGVLNDDKGFVRTQLPKGGHRVKIAGIKYNANVNGASLGAISIYEFDKATTTETLVWSAKSVDATTTSHDFSLNPITSGEGNELIVEVTDATSLTDDAANFLQVDYIRE